MDEHAVIRAQLLQIAMTGTWDGEHATLFKDHPMHVASQLLYHERGPMPQEAMSSFVGRPAAALKRLELLNKLYPPEA